MLLLLVILFIIGAFYRRTQIKETFKEPIPMLLSDLKICGQYAHDCDGSGIDGQECCTPEEKKRYAIEAKLVKAKHMVTPKSPLDKKEYYTFFQPLQIGIKPVCIARDGCYAVPTVTDKYIKYIDDYARWVINSKKFRKVEIPIEMNFVDDLQKLDNIIGYDSRNITNDLNTYHLDLHKEIKTQAELEKKVEDMVRAKAIFSKKKVVIIFKMKPTEDNIFYWASITKDDEYLFINDLLKSNNIPITTNEKC